MKLVVDQDQRYAKMRAHTATHLLHAELAKIFPNTKQAGSLVDDDYLRFDFVADRLLDQFEVDKINKVINQIIYFAYPVKVDETSYKEAIKLGAKAFFEDKYGDEVRVVQIVGNISTQDGDEPVKSIELCGGTHVENTKDIGCFMIISQEAVASGVKRITAYTGPKVYERVQELQSILDITVNKLGIKTASQLEDKLDKTLKEYEIIKEAFDKNEKEKMLESLIKEQQKYNDLFENIIKVPSSYNFKTAVLMLKDMYSNKTVLICNQDGNYAIFASGINSAKKIAEKINLKGGGNESLFQGRDDGAIDIYNKAAFLGISIVSFGDNISEPSGSLQDYTVSN